MDRHRLSVYVAFPTEIMMASPSQDCTADLPASKAFLKLLRWLENYPRDDDGVYWVTYGGGTFSDASSHPNTPHKKWGHTSTAAGAYQIVFGTWAAAKRNGVAFDFMPASQDEVAWWIIGQSRAQALVCGGGVQLEKAFVALSSQWSSLPGAAQSQVSAAEAKAQYGQYLASFAAMQPSSR